MNVQIFARKAGDASSTQKRLGIDIPRDEAFKIAMDYAHWTINPRIFRAFVEKSGNTIKWLEENGLRFDNVPPLVKERGIEF